jgi:hypothetical protein
MVHRLFLRPTKEAMLDGDYGMLCYTRLHKTANWAPQPAYSFIFSIGYAFDKLTKDIGTKHTIMPHAWTPQRVDFPMATQAEIRRASEYQMNA